MAKRLGNVLGAFSDGAILFPLIAALSVSSGFSASVLFATTGVAYVLAGAWFQIPMPVQPLKAISIAAVASGASALEVRWAGATLGLLCLLALALRAERIADRVPDFVVHGVQAGLGVLLLRKAFEVAWPTLPHWSDRENLLVVSASLACWYIGRTLGLSFLGLLAALGAVVGLHSAAAPVTSPTEMNIPLRWGLVLSLALPQVILTGANSVIATRDAAHRYFGESARRVTIPRLLTSIGIGNLVVAGLGGLPFCHGSGGLTAHVRGGAYHWTSNVIIGGFLLALATTQFIFGATFLRYPPLLLALLLAIVGYHHVRLATPTWEKGIYRLPLLVMVALALVTQSLLWSLVGGAVTVPIAQMPLLRRQPI